MSHRAACLALLLAGAALARPGIVPPGGVVPIDPLPGTTLTLGEPSGVLRPLLGVNIGPIPAGDATVDLTEAYHVAGVTTIRTHDYYGPLDMATLYPDQDADPASPASYDFGASDAVFARILAGGFEPYLRLGDSYSAAPGYPPAVPRRPRNAAHWVKAAVEVVRHYESLARSARRPLTRVEIWNEPDNARFWDGTREEFCALYVAAARAIKSAFPHLLVGGPGWAPSGALAPNGRAFTRAFVAAVASAGAPLDFLSFHVYSNDPETYRGMARFYRAALDGAGLTAVPLDVSEWNTETRNATAAEALELRTGGRGAAIVTAAQIVLQEEGIVSSCLYRGPDPSVNAPQFYGIFHADGRPKRAALAFSLWKRLADHPERLAIAAERLAGPALYAIAGRDAAGEIAVLVANPSSAAAAFRVARRDGAVTQLLVEEVSDAAETIVSRPVTGDTVGVPPHAALFVTLRP